MFYWQKEVYLKVIEIFFSAVSDHNYRNVLKKKDTPQQHKTKLISDSIIDFHQNGSYSASDTTLDYAKAHGYSTRLTKSFFNIKNIAFINY